MLGRLGMKRRGCKDCGKPWPQHDWDCKHSPRGVRRINPVSKKQRAKNAARKPVRDDYLRQHPRCEMGGVREDLPVHVQRVCLIQATEVHEPWSRARGGPIDDARNMKALCRRCHSWLTFDAEGIRWAQEHGFLIHALAGPAWLEAQS